MHPFGLSALWKASPKWFQRPWNLPREVFQLVSFSWKEKQLFRTGRDGKQAWAIRLLSLIYSVIWPRHLTSAICNFDAFLCFFFFFITTKDLPLRNTETLLRIFWRSITKNLAYWSTSKIHSCLYNKKACSHRFCLKCNMACTSKTSCEKLRKNCGGQRPQKCPPY